MKEYIRDLMIDKLMEVKYKIAEAHYKDKSTISIIESSRIEAHYFGLYEEVDRVITFIKQQEFKR